MNPIPEEKYICSEPNTHEHDYDEWWACAVHNILVGKAYLESLEARISALERECHDLHTKDPGTGMALITTLYGIDHLKFRPFLDAIDRNDPNGYMQVFKKISALEDLVKKKDAALHEYRDRDLLRTNLKKGKAVLKLEEKTP